MQSPTTAPPGPPSLVKGTFALGLFTIAAAWSSQLFGGLVPCDLCLEQRLAYYWGLPLLALALLLWARLPKTVRAALLVVVAAIFAWGAWMSGYHAGVEWGWWPGPTACSGVGGAIDFSSLSNINAARVVPCDQVQFRFLGISLAGYNFLISVALTVLSLVSAARSREQYRS